MPEDGLVWACHFANECAEARPYAELYSWWWQSQPNLKAPDA